MARKVKRPPPRVEPPPTPGVVPLVPPDVVQQPSEKRKPGRPSNAELAARAALLDRPAPSTLIEPKDMLGVTAALLAGFAAVVKGDNATPDETDRVNGALVAVANKHGGRFKYFEEAMLAIALVTTAVAMRARARDRRDAERARRAGEKVVSISGDPLRAALQDASPPAEPSPAPPT